MKFVDLADNTITITITMSLEHAYELTNDLAHNIRIYRFALQTNMYYVK